MKCGTRKSPCCRLHPVTGTPGPPSGPPTECAPEIVMCPPARAFASCAAVGRVISGPVSAPTMVNVMPRRNAPSERPVDETLPPQRDGDRHAHQRLHQDRAAHHEKQHRIERRRHVRYQGAINGRRKDCLNQGFSGAVHLALNSSDQFSTTDTMPLGGSGACAR